MGFRKYIIRNRDEEAWLVNIFIDKGIKTYRYMPDAGMAIQYETKTEADKVAAACRGRVQILKMDSTIPVILVVSVNTLAWVMAFCPVVASSTRNTS